jgi:hypothetical protein
VKQAKDKSKKLKPEYKPDKVCMNYDITLAILGLGIIVMLGVIIFNH